jgi:hypothetical protein
MVRTAIVSVCIVVASAAHAQDHGTFGVMICF